MQPPFIDTQITMQVQHWNGFYMVKEGAGPYAGAVIKFSIRIVLGTYPRIIPRVFFDDSVKLFHPLVNFATNELKLQREW